MIKDILLNLSVAGGRDGARAFAFSVADAFGAHLTAVAYNYEFVVPGLVFDGTLASGLIDTRCRENERAATQAKSTFEEDARRAGLACEALLAKATLDGAGQHFGRLARTFDLSVVGRAGGADGEQVEAIIEGALFESGRPVVVIPETHDAALKHDRITVCWDGGRPAARAVADAMPFLHRSKVVDLLTVDTGRTAAGDIAGADIAAHLARHGLTVELNRASAAEKDVASAILSHAADAGSDLLVMGGYGHSRLREFVLGGVTREILQRTTLPTLMAH